jgi:acetyl-CoA carboxylase biotin carboxyl carrier protein
MRRTMAREALTEVVAEMVANVLAVSVEVGVPVEAGSTMILMESMKMEIPVIADRPGTVVDVRVSPGDVVQEGDILLVLE